MNFLENWEVSILYLATKFELDWRTNDWYLLSDIQNGKKTLVQKKNKNKKKKKNKNKKKKKQKQKQKNKNKLLL